MSTKLYYNGDIITMEDETYAEAIFIRDGIIEKVGTYEEVTKVKDENTEIIDLNGKTLLPAFLDPHSHLTAMGSTLSLVPLSEVTSNEEIIEKIKDFKEKNNLGPGEWIIGFGYDNNNLPGIAHPTKDILDKASTENPILITHASGHMAVANTVALNELGITNESIDPEGGRIGRVDGSNEPNGYLEEKAFITVSQKIPQKSLEEVCKFVALAQDIYLSYGITTVQDGIVRNLEMPQLKYLADNNMLKVDVVGYVDIKDFKNLLDENKEYVKKYVNNLKLGGYKMFLDGSPQGKTAWLTEPYESSDDGYKGYPIYTDPEALRLVETAVKEDIQLLTHCNGDAAADQLINSFKKALQEPGSSKTTRPVMIHAQTVRYDQIDEMKEINMIPSFFLAHTYFWGDVHIKNLGMERASRISPAKTTIEKAVPFTLHQDSPVIMPDMLFTIWCAVNRITKAGVELGDSERISPLDALKAITINAAYQYFEEDTKGSLKEGKYADLVILDKNPLKVPPMSIKDIKVLNTIKKGEVLYTAK